MDVDAAGSIANDERPSVLQNTMETTEFGITANSIAGVGIYYLIISPT